MGLLALLPLACGAGVSPVQEPGGKQPAQIEALVVPLRGQMGVVEIAACHRALRTEGLQSVVFLLDSTGGLSESQADVEALLDRVMASEVDTVAVVRGGVTGGGAYLALCCRRLFFMPNGHLHGLTPTDIPLEELLGLAEDGAEHRRLRAFGAGVVERLQRRQDKWDSNAIRLCQGMADPTQQMVRATVVEGGVQVLKVLNETELRSLAGSGVQIVAQAPMTRPVSISAAEADEFRMSKGIVQSIEELATEQLDLPLEAVAQIEPSWSERAVSWLTPLQPFLLVAGFVLLLLELKTAGFGLPGVLGAACLGLALLQSYLVGLAEVSEIVLFVLGLAALATEIFVLPGTVVFGAVGFVCLLASLVLSQQSFIVPRTDVEDDILLANLLQLVLLLSLVLVLAGVLWRVLPRIPLLNRVYLPAPEPGAAAVVAPGIGSPRPDRALVGRIGRAFTTLRPAGVAEIGSERYDVVTSGAFLDKDTPVRVIAVEGTKVVVEAERAGDGGERGSVGVVLMILVVGLCLLVAEVIFVSFGVLSVLSGSALITAVFLAFQESTGFGYTVLLFELVAAPVVFVLAFKALPHTPFGRKLMLEGPTRQEVHAAGADPSLAGLLNKEGVALSPLRPAGIARIDGRRVDVMTRGEMLPADVTVRVIDVGGNRVVVTALQSQGPTKNGETNVRS